MNFRKKEDGGITLEAAIFMPIFIMFLVFLLFMIRFALTDIALNKAVSETAKQIALQSYPIHRVIDTGGKMATEALNKSDHYQQIKDDMGKNKDQIENELINTLGEDGYNQLIADPLAKARDDAIDGVTAQFLETIVQGYLADADRMNLIDASSVSVVSPIKFPNLLNEDGNKFILITAEYRLVLPIPFLNREYTLQKQAYERVWLGS
ncbi:TadE/TadG family type IV pilus assembly protein [Halalkalibacter alkaliphilus]|uniref:Pilus assembly protein n=1 Tax=Halalkalibacter alkaliphilus TaxID=2917993 RepID=A0A9X2CTF7_9BACI|nr:TadE family protein [Halalkalibacter alkaliphilus]MCL7748016.1 pilus assembly protein [Halalkalibacter alkaliphilus]